MTERTIAVVDAGLTRLTAGVARAGRAMRIRAFGTTDRGSSTRRGSAEGPQFPTYWVIAAAVTASTTVLTLLPDTVKTTYLGTAPGRPVGFFAPFLGDIPPLAAIATVAVAGSLGLRYLVSQRGFAIRRRPAEGIWVAVAVAVAFGVVAAMVELIGVFREPADMNVPLPYAVLFYPVVGFVVEILFKVVPLALLLAALGWLGSVIGPTRRPSRVTLVAVCMLLVALVEPIYIVSREPGSFGPAQAYVGAQVFAINAVQLWLFRRYDFATMYAFRLGYYAVWHLAWGWLRLQVLY